MIFANTFMSTQKHGKEDTLRQYEHAAIRKTFRGFIIPDENAVSIFIRHQTPTLAL